MRKSELSPDPIRDAPEGHGEHQAPGPFCLMPARAVVDERMYKYASTFVVLAYCCAHARQYTGIFFVNQQTIGAALKVTQSAVAQHFRKLVDWGYIEKIRQESQRRNYGKKGAAWRVIFDPRLTLKDVVNTVPKTEEEITKEALDTIETGNRGAKGQLSKQPKVTVDNSDVALAPANNTNNPNVCKHKPQLIQVHKPQLMHKLNYYNYDKGKEISLLEKEKKEKVNTRTRQPERACRAICAAYADVFQNATGTRWQYDDRQVSIAAAILNAGHTESSFALEAKKTAEWFIGQSQKPPVSLAWFTAKYNSKQGNEPDVDAILGRVKGKARW